MSNEWPVLDQVNMIVDDMDAALAFYRRLGLVIPEPGEWPPGSGARHAEVAMSNGMRLELDNIAMADIWYPGRHQTGSSGSRSVIGFSVDSREAVDTIYADLTDAGYVGCQQPSDAFWGSRYAIVRDPDGNDVGLMSPSDPARRFVPQP